jgi:hypothetical protein
MCTSLTVVSNQQKNHFENMTLPITNDMDGPPPLIIQSGLTQMSEDILIDKHHTLQ